MMRGVLCEFLLAGHWVGYGKLEKKKEDVNVSLKYNTMSDLICACVLPTSPSPSVKILLLCDVYIITLCLVLFLKTLDSNYPPSSPFLFFSI